MHRATCAAYGCDMKAGTNSFSEVKMFSFPKNLKRRQLWEAAVHRDNWKPHSKSRLCNKHFITGQPSKDPQHPDYIPSIFCFNRVENETAVDRFERQKKRRKSSCTLNGNVATKEVACQTDLFSSDIEEMEKVKNEGSNLELQDEGRRILANDKSVQVYTKLPNLEIFNVLLQLILYTWKPKTSCLECSHQLLLVLMKLRLGLINEDLAFRFNISKGSVSIIFKDWISRMAEVLQYYIVAPSKKNLKKHMPVQFKRENWGNVTSIIDCSEIFVDRAFNLDARSLTYSHYKHHNTVKFLVACTPTGQISFISSLFGGRTSDKQITVLSGFINQINSGDVIFADRGFQLEDIIATKNAKIVTPAFTKGKPQLRSKEIMESRKMSRLRVLVERCIGRLKSYRILKYTWPIHLLKSKTKDDACVGDDILIVISALCNITKTAFFKK